MIARGIALCVSLACCTVAMGGAEVVLECVDHPGTCDPGAGGTETINVSLRQVPAGDPHLLRFVQFDLTATDPGLDISLPTTHLFPTGELSPSGDMHFWDFSSTSVCQLAAENCGYGHVVDDELPGALPPGPNIIDITYVGDLSTPTSPDLGPSISNQLLLEGNGTPTLVGQLQVTCGASGGQFRTLDLLNTTEVDLAKGARIDYEFNPHVTWRAQTGDITGGTIQIECGVTNADLLATQPACDTALSRSQGNVIRLTFSQMVTLPAAGDIEVFALDAGGNTTGADLSGDFTYSLESGDTVVRMKETGTALTSPTWYVVQRGASWAGVNAFEVTYVAMPGNANDDNRTDFGDLSFCFAQQTTSAADDDPCDVNDDGRVDFGDLSAANVFNGLTRPARPAGHPCP